MVGNELPLYGLNVACLRMGLGDDQALFHIYFRPSTSFDNCLSCSTICLFTFIGFIRKSPTLPVHCQHVVTGVSITKFVIAAVEPNLGVEGYQTSALDRSSGPRIIDGEAGNHGHLSLA